MLEKVKKITESVSKYYWFLPLIIVICIFTNHDIRHINHELWKIFRIYTYATALVVSLICSAIILLEYRIITAKKYSVLFLTIFVATHSYHLNFYSYELPPLYNINIGPWLTLIIGFFGFKILRSSKILFWKASGYFISFFALLFSAVVLLKTGH